MDGTFFQGFLFTCAHSTDPLLWAHTQPQVSLQNAALPPSKTNNLPRSTAGLGFSVKWHSLSFASLPLDAEYSALWGFHCFHIDLEALRLTCLEDSFSKAAELDFSFVQRFFLANTRHTSTTSTGMYNWFNKNRAIEIASPETIEQTMSQTPPSTCFKNV